MAADESRPKPGRGKNPVPKEGNLPVNEMLGEYQGANSPFGDDVSFPLATDKIEYVHPDPEAVDAY
jgi:succinate dehydrogenase / fumarate reductase iron-sulfur subunit